MRGSVTPNAGQLGCSLKVNSKMERLKSNALPKLYGHIDRFHATPETRNPSLDSTPEACFDISGWDSPPLLLVHVLRMV